MNDTKEKEENGRDHDQEAARDQSLQFLLMQISRRYAGKCLYQVRELGIHPSQIPILMILNHSDGCSQRKMAELLRNKPSTVNVSIQRLEKNGLVCRRRDEKDQRIMRVYLTDKGSEMVAEIKKRVTEMERLMFDKFDATELCLMKRFFLQILDNMESIPGASEEPCRMPEEL